ncbi:2-dehydropantoate 2-reductase [Desulfuromonas versatilis]|uniref:2-dehydropantoate 2-reductase n=1 Tax=Desulfuromonas versatilis TaxID=2802975 RepID=A0ABM8HX98_9BACT|nr:putative 2-dehydropantoate 2-reductase [Desulfuromonas versatilis]BCR06972.1 2-dehydropantoate 2-reductase [Desulfuromonas versatilis]
MKIGVIGSGALGLYYGAMLQRGGQDVRFLLRRDFAAVRAHGLRVQSVDGDFHLESVAGAREASELGEVDLVLVGLKTFANHRLVELVRPLVGENTAILTLQNGLGNEQLLAGAFGAQRVLGGIAFLCANRGKPGTVLHLGQGNIRLGEFAGGLSPRAEAIAEMFRACGVGCEAVADLLRARWEKLVWNVPFNGLCALTGKDVTELLEHPPTRQQVCALMLEVVAGANAQGLSSPVPAEFVERMLSFTDGMDHYRPSMMIDRLEGRPLELEAIYGIPLQQAAARGVEMVRVRMLHALLALGEPGR